MKKLLSMLLTMAMLCTCVSITMVSAADTSTYEPRDFTLTAQTLTSTDYSAVLAWKNPTAEISKITITSIDSAEGSQSYVIENPTANSVSSVVINNLCDANGNLVNYGVFEFELVFEFVDGTKKQIFYADRKTNSSEEDVYAPNSVKVAHHMGTSRVGEFDIFTVKDQNHTTSGNKALKVISNITESDSQGRIWLGTFAPEAGATYKYSFWAYSPNGSAAMQLRSEMYYDSVEVNIPQSNEWQEITGNITIGTEAHGSNNKMRLFMKTPAEAFYIDDMKIEKLTDADAGTYETKWTEDFETVIKTDNSYSAPTTVNAAGADKSVTFTWSGQNASATRFINVYDVTDGNRVLKAKTAHDTSGVTLSYLENNKTYTFEITGQALCGYETDAVTVTAMPSKAYIDNYEYEPGNVMVTNWRNGNSYPDALGASMLSFINPTSDKLNSVKIYRINEDGTETDVTSAAKAHKGNEIAYLNDLATPDADVKLMEYQSAVEGNAKYRLVFGFSDGEIRNIIYTGRYKSNASEYEVFPTVDESKRVIGRGFMSFGLLPNTSNQYNNMSHVGVTIAGTEETNGAVNSYATVVGNHWAYQVDNSGAWTSMANDNGGFYVSNGGLTVGTAYKLSMKIKTIEETKVRATQDGTIITLPDTNGIWQNFEVDFTAKNTNFGIITAGNVGGVTREFSIDDVVVYDSTGTTTILSESFDRGLTLKEAPDATITNGEKSKATISWTTANGAYVKVYEKTEDGALLLRACVPKEEMSVTLLNLENDVEHTFVVKSANKLNEQYSGLESAGVEVTATPTAPDYEITGTELVSETTPVTNGKIVPGGEYTATATVTNYKIEEGVDAQVIVAVYADDVLEGCYVSEAETVSLGTPATLTVPQFTVGSDADAEYTVKLMVWKELSTATPLVRAISFAE